MQYIVRLAPAVERFFRSLEPPDQQELNRALAEELIDGPNADKEIRFDADGRPGVYADPDLPDGATYYTATPLSFKAYTAIHRPMTEDELSRTTRAKNDPASDHGFYVFDILSAESAFVRRMDGPAGWPRPDPPPRR
jgi:hypothetical protein